MNNVLVHSCRDIRAAIRLTRKGLCPHSSIIRRTPAQQMSIVHTVTILEI
jgi:hypothetical protein